VSNTVPEYCRICFLELGTLLVHLKSAQAFCQGSGAGSGFWKQLDPDRYPHYTDKKENQIFLIYKEIQSGAVAKTNMRKGFLIYEEMRK
jgi:hypothetical protein